MPEAPFSDRKARAAARKREKRLKQGALLTVAAFFLLLFVLAFCSLLFFLRPSYSELEKRELAKFPKFSLSALVSGSFFDDINTWFADTFPFREGFLSVNTRIRSLYGLSSATVHGEVAAADDIPDAPPAPTESAASAADEAALAEEAVPSEEETVDLPTQDLGAVLVVGDAAYEYYNFVQSTADKYTAALNKLGGQLAGKTQAYEMVIPTGMDIMLPESFRKNVNTSDQKKAIEYLYGSLGSGITPVDVYQPLQAEKDDYIYFRTDHHWTAKGAYIAYRQYAQAAGFEPTPLSDFTEAVIGGFLGSFYTDTGMNGALAAHPDEIYTYRPADTNDIEITENSGASMTVGIVQDVTGWNQSALYSTFIGGDNPLSVIRNPNLPEGKTCVVVKESFGNAFVPFLTGNYREVYVVDYRYFNKVRSEKLAAFCESVGADDLLIMNNISATRSDGLMQRMISLIG